MLSKLYQIIKFFSSRPIRFGIGLPCTLENKENTRPFGVQNGGNNDGSNDDDDSDEGPILYRDDPSDRASKIARKESLSLKLSLRPDRQELINRNILRIQTDNDQQETKEAIGARLIRRLSMRPTAEELVERNILKSNFYYFISVFLSIYHYHKYYCSSNSRRAKEIKRGEEKLSFAKIEFPTHC